MIQDSLGIILTNLALGATQYGHGKMNSLETRASNVTCQDCRVLGMSLTGREEVCRGVLSDSKVSMLLTEDGNSVLRNRLVRPRKKMYLHV